MALTPLDTAVLIARALGHRGRLRMVAMLQSGELCVCQLTEVLKLAPSTVSLHLKELKRSELLTERRDGRWVYLALSEDPAVRPWIETTLAALADDPQLEADDEMVAQLRRLPVEDLCQLGYEEARARQVGAPASRRRGRHHRVD